MSVQRISSACFVIERVEEERMERERRALFSAFWSLPKEERMRRSPMFQLSVARENSL